MLRMLALAVRMSIGEREDTVVEFDDADLVANVARQSRVRARIEVAYAHSVADTEARGDMFGDAGGRPCGDQSRNDLSGQQHQFASSCRSCATRASSSARVTMPRLSSTSSNAY